MITLHKQRTTCFESLDYFAFQRDAFSLFHLLLTDVLAPAVVTDPEDPRFDLEKLIAKWESS
jgi:hypothetical protein